jgi:catechol 2,3-dioxygenase-like lactoylglutathione lyase family enzyme
MPFTIGFNHVAINTPDLDRLKRFYEDAFDAEVTFEMDATSDHPRMAILSLGGVGFLNAFEVPADSIIGDRRTMGGRGPIDHYALAVKRRHELVEARERLVAAGAEVGEIQQLGEGWSLFFRDPDGMELEVCAES